MKKHIVVIVALMVQVAVAVNLQNITLTGGYKATVKSLARLRENIEADTILDLKTKEDFLRGVKEGEEWAEELRPIDEACPVVMTEKMISDECDEYFDDKLPRFKTSIKKFVVEYKEWRLEALKKSGKKRPFIKQCVEDIFSTDYNPQNFFVGASVELKEEIKKDGYQVNYSIGLLEPKENPVNKWLDGISKLCGKEIIGESSYFLIEIANDYAEEIAKKKNEANGKYAYSYLEFKGAPERTLEKKELKKIYEMEEKPIGLTYWRGNYEYQLGKGLIGNRLLIKYKKDSDFYYSLNGKDVLHCKISGYADEINFNGRSFNPPAIISNRYDENNIGPYLRGNLACDCINGNLVGNKCKGSMLVTDEEFEKGFVGVFSWDKSSDNNSTKKKSAECDNPNLTPKEQKKCRVQKR